MKRIVLGVWLLASLAACDDSTQPAEPSSTPPAAAAVAVEQQFTVRDLGTLGGTISHANSINEQGEVAGVAPKRSRRATSISVARRTGYAEPGHAGRISEQGSRHQRPNRGGRLQRDPSRLARDPGVPLERGGRHAEPRDPGG